LSPKQLLSGKQQQLDYRLLWVGSDDAVCHLGTGLHKVPLARLQEVFVSLLPNSNSNIQLTEVIRILGPFPNVKNTLQGRCSSSSSNSSGSRKQDWKLVWDSMIDGTGKELLAGKEQNTRIVLLDVYYSDEQVIVAAVPGTTTPTQDPLEDKGKHVLVFVRDDALDEKLVALRVA
jgi:hypothetical protein